MGMQSKLAIQADWAMGTLKGGLAMGTLKGGLRHMCAIRQDKLPSACSSPEPTTGI